MIELITRLEIDWNEFVNNISAYTGVSPTRALDSINIRAGSYESYIIALGQIENPGVSPITFLKSPQADKVLDHLFFSFFFVTSPFNMIGTNGIAITFVLKDQEIIGIMSGTLKQFRNFIVQNMTKNRPVRSFVMELLEKFIKLGFREIFS